KLDSILLASETIKPFQNKKDNRSLKRDFIASIDDNTRAWEIKNGTNSPLHKIFEHIREHTVKDKVSLFITESIMSYTQGDLVGAQYSNIDTLGLSGKMKIEFDDLQKSGCAVSILAFKSQYNGTYTDFANNSYPCCKESRPYYIWVVGKANVIPNFMAHLLKNNDIKPEQQAHFGWTIPVPAYAILPQVKRGGGWQYDTETKVPQKIMGIKVSEENAFTIAIDLSGDIFNKLFTENYLKNNLELVTNQGYAKASKVEIYTQKEILKDPTVTSEQKQEITKYTHFVYVKLDNESLAEDVGKFMVRLKKNNEFKWFATWSANHATENTNLGRTYGFYSLTKPLLTAYQTDKYYF
ncbi:MAG: hypothetical protein EAZ31_08705, partial [Cytophagia bacterium]